MFETNVRNKGSKRDPYKNIYKLTLKATLITNQGPIYYLPFTLFLFFFNTTNLETRIASFYSDFSWPVAAAVVVVVVEVELLSSVFEATGHMLLRLPFRADIGHPVAAALGGSPAP